VLYRLARPLLFALDPERAHRVTLRSLGWLDALRLLPSSAAAPSPSTVMGLQFPNPVGLAAGLDKNGEHIDALARLGFGFIEVGTVTPRPQPGNPSPRLFRIPQANALINRMGFNNHGVETLLFNVRAARYRGVLGVNIGRNFDTPPERAAGDYLYCLRKVYALASYVTVNVSSPNTAGLRDLQQADALERLLEALVRERERLAADSGRRVPLAVKIAPDLESRELEAIAALLVRYGIDATVATNTTVSRAGVEGLRHSQEAGGLSGAPLREKALAAQRQLAQALAGRVPIIGVGGILSGADANEKMAAGASLVQLYTGLVYRGPCLIAEAIAACAR
jgi:dihydroorotate dehydrogenase